MLEAPTKEVSQLVGLRLIVTSVLLMVIPAVFLVWLRASTDERMAALEPDPVPLVSPVEERADDGLSTVIVTGHWDQPDALISPGWHGKVISVDVKPGDVVATGDVVASIDGVLRVAIATPKPFWRTLRRRDEGPDVEMLQRCLAASGLYEGNIDGLYGRSLATAVKTWATELGVQKPDGSFDPAWTVWLTPDPFHVESVDLLPGSPAPPEGSAIAASPTRLASISLTGTDGSTIVVDGEWTLELQGKEFPLTDGQPPTSDLAELTVLLPIDGPPPVAHVRLTDPVERLTIPITAVVTAYDGTFCVYAESGSEFAPKPVEIGSGTLSTIDIVQGVARGDQILANPSDILDSPGCR